MRISPNALLALPALLSAFVVAVPSPSYLHESVTVRSTQQQSRWKALSDRLIATVWGVDKAKTAPESRYRLNLNRYAPSHPLARYGGDVVLRFNVSTEAETGSLAEAADTLLLDVWDFSQDWVDIRLAVDLVPSLLGLLPTSLQQSYTPLLHERDLAQAIYDSYPIPQGRSPAPTTTSPPHIRNRPALQLHGTQRDDFFANYQPLYVIEPWMRLFASLYTSHVRLIKIGVSYEGRDILGLRVGVHPTNDEDPDPPKRKTVLMTGGVHAREWISTSTVNYVARNLITGYGKVPSITQLLENFDFVFVPTLNPDGYVYTWETDRLWRKNRQQTNVRFCQGIDLDRGYGFEWDGVSTAGNPCSESFAGDEPFEAVESKRLADWAKNETENNNVQFVGFLDLHSYSQQILYPYSYSCSDTPPGQENLEEVAVGLEKAIRVSSGMAYEPMPACEGNVGLDRKAGKRTILPRIESQGGSALDWFYHEMQVRYAYQIKLRDRGTYGFLLPKENIEPTGREISEAVLYFGQFLQELYTTKDSQDVAMERPELGINSEESDDSSEAEDWIIVDDLVEAEPVSSQKNPDAIQLELRRRRKR
jgi:extracellular matrix protein 14